jgi:hypothetical protein
MPDGSQPEQHLHKLRLDAPVDKRRRPAAKDTSLRDEVDPFLGMQGVKDDR